MSITEISIKRPLLISVIFITLILFGLLCYNTLNYNLLPKLESNTISLSTTYRGASPEEVQSGVTKPIEDAVSAVEGVDQLTSKSSEGLSVVSISLKSGVDMNAAQLEAERKIDQIRALFPASVDEPVVRKFSQDDMPIMKVSVTSSISGTELYDFINLQVKPLLTNIEGVAQVDVIGGTPREIKISMDNNKMNIYNISVAEINQAVANSGVSFPAGAIKNANSRFAIDMNAKVASLEELRNLVVRQNDDGSRLLLQDVASVRDSCQDPATINRINGVEATGLEIKKQYDANAVNVSQQLREKLEEVKTDFASKDFNYQIASDQSVYTLESADAVIHDLVLAILIVAGVMLFFLHSLRSASFVLVAIPSAMIPTFIGMWYFGFSLNLMTLLGLSLVVGILVDDCIVILENIYRHMGMGKDKRTAALEGRNEIGFTALAITLVDVVVFLPLALAGGLIGNILKEYALVVVFSTLMSLLVAFTLTPMLASRWGKLTPLSNKTFWGRLNLKFESLIDQLRDTYTQILRWSLGHKRWIFLFVSALIVASVALIPAGFVGTSFIPAADRGELTIQLDLASHVSLEQTNQAVAEVEKLLMAHPEVVNVFSNVGTQQGASGGTSQGGNSNLAELTVVLTDQDDRKLSTEEFTELLREDIRSIPGIKHTIGTVGISGNSAPELQLTVTGTDVDSVMRAANLTRDIMNKTAGVDYVRYSTKESKRQISVTLDRDKLSTLGLSITELGTSVQYAFSGNNNTKFREKGEEYDIVLELDESERQSIGDVRNLNIYNKRGKTIRLSEVADIRETMGYSSLERKGRMNSITINAAAVGRPSGTIMSEVQAKLGTIKLPEGTYIQTAGMAKNQGDAFGSLFLSMGIGILLMYLIMVALYESVVYPFVVLFSLPVAIIGAILGLALTLNTLNIFSILGLIMSLGLVAKNAILIVDFANQEKEKGLSVTEALIAAGRERLRPILMTTLAMILGILPMALASGAGSETKNAMAWVIIGALTSSMIFTLVLVPAVYVVIEKLKNKVQGLFRPSSIPATSSPAID